MVDGPFAQEANLELLQLLAIRQFPETNDENDLLVRGMLG